MSRPELTITVEAAHELIDEASDNGRKLLEMFAEDQVFGLEALGEKFGMDHRGLNGVLSGLIRKFQQIEEDGRASFYVWLRSRGEWAVGYLTHKNLRQAFAERERNQVAR